MPLNELNIIRLPIEDLTLLENNAKIHTSEQIKHIANSITEFGMNDPIGIWGNKNIIIEGNGRYLACKELGINEVDCIRLDHLTDEQRRAYALAHNLTNAETGFDLEILCNEIEKLDFDFAEFGLNFDLNLPAEAPNIVIEEDKYVPEVLQNIVKLNRGDVFEIGEHRLIYGDSTDKKDIAKLMDGKQSNMIFTDPPYNLSADDIGSVASDEDFINAGGEMTDNEFTEFLIKVVNNLYDFSIENSIHYICMDWRHALNLLTACKKYEKFKNICVWKKPNANLSSFYRNQHELIFVFQKGTGQYTCNFSFKDYRTNIWEYSGQCHPKWAEMQGIERVHPTMKPLQLVADAIQDCSKAGDIILDLFGGSGSTMVAAHQTGRIGYLSELDEKYCNVIIRRMLLLDNKLKVICNGKDVTEVFRISQLSSIKNEKDNTYQIIITLENKKEVNKILPQIVDLLKDNPNNFYQVIKGK